MSANGLSSNGGVLRCVTAANGDDVAAVIGGLLFEVSTRPQSGGSWRLAFTDGAGRAHQRAITVEEAVDAAFNVWLGIQNLHQCGLGVLHELERSGFSVNGSADPWILTVQLTEETTIFVAPNPLPKGGEPE